MNVLALCAGVGGLDLGLNLAEPSSRCVCYVEGEAYAASVLVSRMEDEALGEAPIWSDVRTFDARPWRGVVDCVTGGYPCQPFSVAGRKLGDADPRHLWPHVARVVDECRPEWCFFENVANHLRLGFRVVADDLRRLGYRVAAGLFTAAEVGAPHKRERLFIVAHNDNFRSEPLRDGPREAIGGEGRGRGSIEQLGPYVADLSGYGRGQGGGPQSRESGGGVADRTLDGGCEVMADPRSLRRQQDARGPLGDEASHGGEGRHPRESDGDHQPQRDDEGVCGGERPHERTTWRPSGPFPPPPGAVGEWGRVLASDSGLAPAIESPLRGMADGLAPRVDGDSYSIWRRVNEAMLSLLCGDHIEGSAAGKILWAGLLRGESAALLAVERCRAEAGAKGGPVDGVRAMQVYNQFTEAPPRHSDGPRPSSGPLSGMPHGGRYGAGEVGRAGVYPSRVDRLRACGNGVVPLAAAYAWRTLKADLMRTV